MMKTNRGTREPGGVASQRQARCQEGSRLKMPASGLRQCGCNIIVHPPPEHMIGTYLLGSRYTPLGTHEKAGVVSTGCQSSSPAFAIRALGFSGASFGKAVPTFLRSSLLGWKREQCRQGPCQGS